MSSLRNPICVIREEEEDGEVTFEEEGRGEMEEPCRGALLKGERRERRDGVTQQKQISRP